MKKNERWYHRRTRQSPVAILFIIYKVTRAIVRGWWPLIVVVLIQSDRFSRETLVIGLSIIGLLIVSLSIISYLRFFFVIKNDQLHVERGILRRTRLDIPLDRVQSISFDQPLMHRPFGVVQVKIDTAGSAAEEFSFSALALSKAEELRNLLQRDRKLQVETTSEMTHSEILLLNLKPRDLFKIGVSENHFRTIGLIIFFLGSFSGQLQEAMGDRFEEEIEKLGGYITIPPLMFTITLLITLLIAAFLVTLMRTLVRYYDLKLWQKPGGYRVNSGLLSRYEQAVARTKIQFLQWKTNPLKKVFGIVSFRFFQASSEALAQAKAITIPGCTLAQRDQIARQYFGNQSSASQIFTVNRRLFIRRWLFLGWIPATALLILFFAMGKFLLLVATVLWLLLSRWYQARHYHKWHAWIDTQVLEVTSGTIEQTTRMLAQYKIQSLKLRQTPYQRRHDLATLQIYTASGALRIPYIPIDQAIAAKNRLMYVVESSRKRWM